MQETRLAGGHQVIAVVSAMAGVTNDLLAQAASGAATPRGDEVDVVVAAGAGLTTNGSMLVPPNATGWFQPA